ncbi:MAG: hypothetical protein WD768_21650 [Phycisphaeraceae bacterium]
MPRFMPRSMHIVILLLAITASAAADVKTISNGGRGSLELKLDRTELGAEEIIEGRLIFQLDEVRDKFNTAYDAIRFNGPQLNIVFPSDMAAVPLEVKWRTTVLPTFGVGRRFELPFIIRMDPAFRALLAKSDDVYRLFADGSFRISATIESPARAAGEEVTKSQFPELYQTFVSQPLTLKINRSRVAKAIDDDTVKRMIAAAEPGVRLKIVMFYAQRGVLSKKDLAAEIESASGKMKAELASFWLSMKYPASELKFFTPSGQTIKFTGHDDPPVYVLVRPQQRLHVAFDVATLHHFRAADVDTPIVTKKQITVDMPRGEGVYEMYDQQNGKPWGWLLVHKDPESRVEGLRPDTRELSTKVVEALVKRDTNALKRLAAPDYDVELALKLTRFKLAEGDIRYHESTGTSNKVRTRLKINLAPAGKEPVFARELLLEFVLVGDELKLTHANVLDVQR